MRKMISSLALGLLMVAGVNAQEKGDWYVGAGDVSNTAWTAWSVSPTIGYGVTNNLMIGAAANQEVDGDLAVDIHARYFVKGCFVYLGSNLGLDTEQMEIGVGKMFTFSGNVYVDPRLVYDAGNKTTNLGLGVGLKF
jgi:hypothetical protein|tara:strand:- start:28 stop:438 length:411 start_codon:yes stop_codon:yes gene_type:complete